MPAYLVRERLTSLFSRPSKTARVVRAAARPAFEALEGRALFSACSPVTVCPAPVVHTPAPVCPTPAPVTPAPAPICGPVYPGLVSGASIANDFTSSLDQYGILGAGNSNVSCGPGTHVGGDVAIGKGSVGAFCNTQIDGNLDIDSGAKISQYSNVKISGSPNITSLSTASALCGDAAARIAGLTPTQTLGNVCSSTTISSTSNVSIVNINSIQLSGHSTLTINGAVGSYFMINVFGNFNMSQWSSIQLTGGIQEPHVLFNIVGAGSAVTFTGNSVAVGTILAENRDVIVSQATVDGAILGAYCHTIAISCGAQVQVEAPHFQPPIGY